MQRHNLGQSGLQQGFPSGRLRISSRDAVNDPNFGRYHNSCVRDPTSLTKELAYESLCCGL
jgi:hypothetical protein